MNYSNVSTKLKATTVSAIDISANIASPVSSSFQVRQHSPSIVKTNKTTSMW